MGWWSNFGRKAHGVNAATNRGVVCEPLEDRTLWAVSPSGFSETQIVSGLRKPTSMAMAPDGRIFVTEKGGTLRVVRNGQLLGTPAITLAVNTFAERGLGHVALDPDFDDNGHVYLYYTAETSQGFQNRISRFTVSGDTIDPDTKLNLLTLPSLNSSIHNGGAMRFGADGKMYVFVGENAKPLEAQSLNSPLGKVLRINTDGSIPTDNPFYDETTGINRAIWALGLRNPWGGDIDPVTGRMHVNDVGPGESQSDEDTWEEINLGEAGANYGWPGIQGYRDNETRPSGYRDPLYSYNHGPSESIGEAITGGAFYRAPDAATHPYPDNYDGDYFFTDYKGFWIKKLNSADNTVTTFATNLRRPVDLKVGADGSLYSLSFGNADADGAVVRYRYIVSTAPTIVAPPQSRTVKDGESVTFSIQANGTAPLAFQWQRDGQDIPGATDSSYTIDSTQASDNGTLFRVRVSNSVGSVTSAVATLTVTGNQAPQPFITTPAVGLKVPGGATVAFSGGANDPEDGALAGASLVWRVDYLRGGTPSPLLDVATGASGEFQTPSITPYLRPDVSYRVYLTATDSAGRSTTVFRDVLPQTVDLKLRTNVAGLSLNLDGQSVAAPHAFTSVVGLERTIGAPLTQVVHGVTYDFVEWSDHTGTSTRELTIPDDPTTWTALYAPRPGSGPRVTRLVLIDADTDQEIGELTGGMALDLAALPTRKLNVRADAEDGTASVRFALDDAADFRTDGGAPFSIGGDSGSDYLPWTPALGQHVLMATGYSAAGAAGTPLTVAFTVTDSNPPPTVPDVTGLTLVNGFLNTDIGAMTGGMTINLAQTPYLNVRASVLGSSPVGSIRFVLDGQTFSTDNDGSPYTLRPYMNGDYFSWTPKVGQHTLIVTAYEGANGTGDAGESFTVTFNVVNGTSPPPTSPPPTSPPPTSPPPTSPPPTSPPPTSPPPTSPPPTSPPPTSPPPTSPPPTSPPPTSPPPTSPPPTSPSEVTALTLVDGFRNIDIGAMTGGMTINLAQTPYLNVRASVLASSPVGSVRFVLDGQTFSTDNDGIPYTLRPYVNGDYFSWTPTKGQHTLVVTPYGGLNGTGTVGAPITVNFTVVNGTSPPASPPPTSPPPTSPPPTSPPPTSPPPTSPPPTSPPPTSPPPTSPPPTSPPPTSPPPTSPPPTSPPPSSSSVPAIASATLVNGFLNRDIGVMTDGMTINLAQTPYLNVRASVLGSSPVGSVRFVLDGQTFSTDNDGSPYTLRPYMNGDYFSWTPTKGQHTLVVTAYEGANGTGEAGAPMTIQFTVVNGTSPSGNLVGEPGGDPTPGTPVVVQALADTYVRGGPSAGTPFGAATEMQVKRADDDPSRERVAYLKFDLSGVDTVASAVLRLHGRLNTGQNGGVMIGAYAVSDNSWTEAGNTYDNRPAVGPAIAPATSVSAVVYTWVSWDVTAYLRQQKLAGNDLVTIAIVADQFSPAFAAFESRDSAGGNGPQLTVTP